jgi:hypothetical protein
MKKIQRPTTVFVGWGAGLTNFSGREFVKKITFNFPKKPIDFFTKIWYTIIVRREKALNSCL